MEKKNLSQKNIALKNKIAIKNIIRKNYILIAHSRFRC